MFCVLVFVLFISGALTQDTVLDEDDLEAERYNYSCLIPPSDIIRNGRFRVEGYDDDDQPRVGKKTYSYVLQVFCDPGFTMKGWYLVQCITDKGTDEFPECLPTCKRSSPDVFSCGTSFGAEEARCLAPRNLMDESISTLRARSQLQCGVSPQIFRTTVVNGREANREDVPWHAGVYTKITRPYMQICGGTIVSNNVIISAAHCFWTDVDKRLPAENYAVAVGKLFRPWNDTNDPDAQKFDVQEIRIPPRFQGSATNFQDDIALLLLGAPFTIKLSSFITPACLDFNFDFDVRQLAHGKLGRVSGWGLDSEDGPSSQVLNVVELPVVSIEQCIAGSDPGFLPSITSDKICAGYTNGTAVCKGDSGGGLVVPEVVDDVTRFYLRGIVSTAPRSDHICNIYAVATFTHLLKHEHFIMQAISQTPLMNEAPVKTPIPTTFSTVIEDTTKAIDINITDDNRNIEVITENAADTLLTEDDTNIEEDQKNPADTSFLENNNTQNMLSPLPLTNLNSTNSKEKLNNSAIVSNTDDDFRDIFTDLVNLPETNDKGAIEIVKIGLEPITNPPLNKNDNFDENDKGNTDTNEKIEDTGKGDIGLSVEQSFETVNSEPKPVTDIINESSEITEDVSNINTDDNNAQIPALDVPIEITIGQTFETVNTGQNIETSTTDEVFTDTGASKPNDQLEEIPPSTEVISENVGQIFQTINPTVPSSDISIGTVNPLEKPITVKESSQNDDTITIWPITAGTQPGPANDGVDYTQTTSILEDHWVTVSPGYDHGTPGHHHHWPYHHSWHKYPSGPSSHHDWDKYPNWHNSHQNHWQNWNPTNWQQERYHPFIQYHHGFTQQPSKDTPNYPGPWFSKFRISN